MVRSSAMIACLVCTAAVFPFAARAADPAQAPLRPAPLALADTDGDGVPNVWESGVFNTDPDKRDTDGDGFDDWTEITNEYQPAGKEKGKIRDADADGLTDRFELLFGSDPGNTDTDGDGITDGVEVASGYSPVSTSTVLLQKEIVIRISKQQIDQRLGGVTLASFKVSTGVPKMPTPIGQFTVLWKHPRAWSRSAGLWMPWWMQITKRGVGIHELPEWPGGRKEGADHLGHPASHGCVRLGIGPAKTLYDWAPVGTKVSVVR